MAYVIVTSTVPEKITRPVTQGIPQNPPKLDYTFDKPKMPISSMMGLYKVAKVRLLLTRRHPADEKTRDAGTEAMTGMVCEASSGTSQT